MIRWKKKDSMLPVVSLALLTLWTSKDLDFLMNFDEQDSSMKVKLTHREKLFLPPLQFFEQKQYLSCAGAIKGKLNNIEITEETENINLFVSINYCVRIFFFNNVGTGLLMFSTLLELGLNI